jgi:hypothetical protein
MKTSSKNSVITIRRQARDQTRPDGGEPLDESNETAVSA